MKLEKLVIASKVTRNQFIVMYLGVIIGTTGQQIGLPLFISSFGGATGMYFVILWCSVLFNLFFWPVSFYRIYKGTITKEMRAYPKHWKLVPIGVFDALNGILVVYSSSLQRTPGSLQAILGTAVIPFTMLFSKFMLKKKYASHQLLGAFLAFFGIIVSMIPIFDNFEVGSFDFYWPLIFLSGNIPGVLMNIYEEDILRYDRF